MVEFKDVSVTYSSGVDALNKVNLKINDGDFAFVVGPSGAGKSTLIKLVLKRLQSEKAEKKKDTCPSQNYRRCFSGFQTYPYNDSL